MTWMQTYSGIAFDFQDIKPDLISLEDIAWSLSMQCRFNGHTDSFYSVAQHSVLVSRIVPDSAAAWGLLHDAAEAYVCDLPRPVKEYMRRDGSPSFYDDLELVVLHAISKRFGLPRIKGIPAAVHHADNVLLATEKRDLMTAPCQRDWGKLPEPMTQTIVPWSPDMAREKFLKRAEELGVK